MKLEIGMHRIELVTWHQPNTCCDFACIEWSRSRAGDIQRSLLDLQETWLLITSLPHMAWNKLLPLFTCFYSTVRLLEFDKIWCRGVSAERKLSDQRHLSVQRHVFFHLLYYERDLLILFIVHRSISVKYNQRDALLVFNLLWINGLYMFRALSAPTMLATNRHNTHAIYQVFFVQRLLNMRK
jgi:hypothetical protein